MAKAKTRSKTPAKATQATAGRPTRPPVATWR